MALGHRILVPLDGSPLAGGVLPLAASLAGHADSVLHLLAVHTRLLPPSAPPGAARIVAEANRAAEVWLERVVAEAAQEARRMGVRAETEVRTGVPDLEILASAEEHGCDLVVMATHGRGGLRRAWLGSVSDRVSRHATLPVLLAPHPPHGPVRTVIVALDGSAFSEQVLGPATDLGEAAGAEYILYRAIAPATRLLLLPADPFEGGVADYIEHHRAEARGHLDRVASELANAGFQATVMLVEAEDPAASLLRLAEATPDSVVAMTTHGRGGLRRAIFGSVADKVVRGTGRPVLLVRPREGG